MINSNNFSTRYSCKPPPPPDDVEMATIHRDKNA